MNTPPTSDGEANGRPRAGTWTWRVLLVALMLFSFGWRWYYDVSARVSDPMRGDAAQYYNYAYNLYFFHIFSKSADDSQVPVPDSFRDPGYPAFLASWMAMFTDQQDWYAAVILSQAVLGALSVLLLSLLARRWLPPAAAIGAGLLAAIWPHSVAIGSLLLTETLFSLLLLLATYLLVVALELRRGPRFFSAGATFGLASMVNSVVLPLAPLLMIFLRLKRLEWRFALLLLVGALIAPGIWTLRNISIPAGGESNLDRAMINLVQGSWPEYHSAYRGTRVHKTATGPETLARISAEQHRMIESPAEGVSALASRLAGDPARYLVWYLVKKPALFWAWEIEIGQGDIYVFPTRDSPYEENPFWRALRSLCRALNPLILFAAIAGATLILMRRGAGLTAATRTCAATVVLVLIYATAVYDVFQAEPRYSIPFRPFEFAVAATAVTFSIRWLRDRRRVDATAVSSDAEPPERVTEA